MKYFAKYLPVEGEIKEGDHFLFEKKVYLSKNKGSDNVTVESEDWYHNRRQCKKVKLFLCSRDIQVGDKVRSAGCVTMDKWPSGRHLEINGGHNIGKELTIKEYGKGEHNNLWATDENVYIQYPIKVIGEISPEATWVKEGDEFEEDQLKKFTILPPSHLVIYSVENDKLGYPTVIKVKCSQCNTFH